MIRSYQDLDQAFLEEIFAGNSAQECPWLATEDLRRQEIKEAKHVFIYETKEQIMGFAYMDPVQEEKKGKRVRFYMFIRPSGSQEELGVIKALYAAVMEKIPKDSYRVTIALHHSQKSLLSFVEGQGAKTYFISHLYQGIVPQQDLSLQCYALTQEMVRPYAKIHVEGFLPLRKHFDMEPHASYDLSKSDQDLFTEIDQEPGEKYIYYEGQEAVGIAAVTSFLDVIVTDDSHRRKGYGRQILADAGVKLASKGIDILKLYVLSWNQSAMGFYDREGLRIHSSVHVMELPHAAYQ